MTDERAQAERRHEGPRRPDGEQLARISTTVVQLQKRSSGGDRPKARTSWAGDDALICIMGGGFTPVEQTLYESGREEAVLAMRQAFQEAMEGRMREQVESIVGRKVVAFMSTAHQSPDLAVEIFILEPQPNDLESPVRAENEVSPGPL
jgi:uncharacterized protein YbcI